MKSRIARFSLVAGLAVALVGALAFAQQQGNAGPGHPHHGMGGMHEPFGMMLHQLNLTEDQKAQVKKIFQAERPALQPLKQQEFQSHQQMIQLVTGGNFDQAKAAAIATQEAQTHIQLEVEYAKIGSQIYQLLDSTQKAKVADLIAQHQQRMQQHLQGHGQESPATPEQ